MKILNYLLLLGIIVGCKNNNSKSNTKLELNSDKVVISSIKEKLKADIDRKFPSELSDDSYKKPVFEETDSTLRISFFFKEQEPSAVIPGFAREYNLNDIIIGDLNNDNKDDYLISYYDNGGGNACSYGYDIYFKNGDTYKYIGTYDSGGSHTSYIDLKYIKDGKIYGVWHDDFHQFDNKKPDHDVTLELKGTSLKVLN